MKVGGRTIGIVVLLVVVIVSIFAYRYTVTLEAQRNTSIEQLMSLPQNANCPYDDASLCPQAQNTIVLPDITAVLLVLLSILLSIYLIRSERVSSGILSELKDRKSGLSRDERRTLVLSVLTKDERAIVEAVEQQPGISQATLRLRVDMSKAKLCGLLQELEQRKIIVKDNQGKTNAVHLKREW